MIKVGGIQKISLIDYPDKISASVFLAGCNFRCPYCHNPDLIEINSHKKYISTRELFSYLKKRQGLIDGVCISGGEPLIYKELEPFIRGIKDMGYLIKLDTNGFFPEHLQKLIDLKLIDYIAMDIKASLGNYERVTRIKSDFKNIKKSIKIIMDSGLDYEFRTTVLPKFHNLEEIEKIAKMIKDAKKYYLQRFINKNTLDPAFLYEKAFTEGQLEKLKNKALQYVKICHIRG